MEKSKINLSRINQRYGILSLLVLLAAFSRVIPHPSNFAPMGAMALFGAAYFTKKYIAVLIPIPFFKNILLGDLVYCGVLFGSFEFAQRKFPALRLNPQLS